MSPVQSTGGGHKVLLHDADLHQLRTNTTEPQLELDHLTVVKPISTFYRTVAAESFSYPDERNKLLTGVVFTAAERESNCKTSH